MFFVEGVAFALDLGLGGHCDDGMGYGTLLGLSSRFVWLSKLDEQTNELASVGTLTV